ncbi:MAG: hypothetical protein JW715_04355 [Sedimentisphaerales bacterium]|nr:hypothetical protein [Sedimentisphaerales bacterium]
MFKHYKISTVLIILLLSVGFIFSDECIAQGSSAQKLTTILPDDVLGFVATSGADELKPDFEKTILSQIWKDPQVQTFYQAIYKELLGKFEQGVNDPEAKKAIDNVLNFAGLVKNRPVVFGVAQKQAEQGPPVYGFAIMEAGPRKAEINAALSKLESMADEGDIIDKKIGNYTLHGPKDDGGVPGYWGWIGDYLVFAINDGTGLAVKYLQNAPMSRPVPAYLQKVSPTSDALAIYVNPEKALQLIAGIAKAEGDEDEFAVIQAVISELGLDKVKTLTSRTGFEGSNLVVNELIEISQPRTGLFSNIKTIDMKVFDMVDGRAMNAVAFNLDLAGVYDTVMKAIEAGAAAADEDFDEIEEAIAEVEQELKFKIRDGLLASLDGQIIFYTLPGGIMPQSPQGGLVFIAKLKDVKLWEQTITAVEKIAAEETNGMIQLSTQVQNDKIMHTWAVAPLALVQIMPTWVVSGDNVIIASNPAMCNMAIEQMNSGRNSIRTTEGFRRVTANVPSNLLSLNYVDSKVQFGQMMTEFQQFWPMLTMVASQSGLKLPFMLPSLTQITEKLGPSCQYCWYDDQGLRSCYRGDGLEQGVGLVAGTAAGVGVMMPALARTRNQARRVVSMSNLKQLGVATIMYANEHDDNLPENFDQMNKYIGGSKVLESPLKPKDFTGPSYILVTGQNVSMDPGNIVIYENPAYCSDRINVLFLDCHVEQMQKDRFLRTLKETYERLDREMPEIKFKN